MVGKHISVNLRIFKKIFILEFGHNWGSEHDPLTPDCTPGSSNGGNYLMYPYSNQGNELNNFVISILNFYMTNQI